MSSSVRVNSRDRVAATVELDPDAVELPFDAAGAADRGQRLGDAGRDWASIGWTGRPTCRLNPARAAAPAAAARPGGHRGRSPLSMAARRTSARDAGRPGERVGHHPVQRALAQLAGEQPAQEKPVRRRWPRRTARPAAAAAACGTCPDRRRSRSSAASTPSTVSVGFGGRRRHAAARPSRPRSAAGAAHRTGTAPPRASSAARPRSTPPARRPWPSRAGVSATA